MVDLRKGQLLHKLTQNLSSALQGFSHISYGTVVISIRSQTGSSAFDSFKFLFQLLLLLHDLLVGLLQSIELNLHGHCFLGGLFLLIFELLHFLKYLVIGQFVTQLQIVALSLCLFGLFELLLHLS